MTASDGLFSQQETITGNLALSRAIGDFEFKQNDQLPAEEQIVTCNVLHTGLIATTVSSPFDPRQS